MKVWLLAARPRTLPAAVAPVLVGSALAFHAGHFRPLPALLCLVFALLAQVAANFANDYFDFVKGADGAARVGPRRAVASGLVSPEAMRRATWGVCSAAFLVGLGLLPFGGWPLLLVGISSLLCAVAYTGGPYPLGYHGLGDIFVFLFFGLVAVGATSFVQTGLLSSDALLAGTAVGLLAANILVVNNFRDVETDRAAGKRTLVVRFGRGFAKLQFCSSHSAALLLPVLFLSRGYYPPLILGFSFVVLSIIALRQCLSLRAKRSPTELISLLGQSGLYLAAYAACLSFWIILSK
jgi:1,4-dihydroxy-2-naphthoate octaprenyltransferase